MSLLFSFLITLSTFPECWECGGTDSAKADPNASYEFRDLTIVSHRGVNKRAPENTRAAAQASIDMGLDYVELYGSTHTKIP